MWRAESNKLQDSSSSPVRDFFDLSAPKPVIESCRKVMATQPRDFSHVSPESFINFKLTKIEDPNNKGLEPNLPTEKDFPELNGDLENIDVNLPNPLPLKVDEDEHILENYSFDHEYSADLPITKYSNEVLSTIDVHSVTVVQGATGSGKTTQVPQYILDHYMKQKRYCNIVVTQPRRIAAISIAKRVCQERSWDVGGIVGYQVGRDKMSSDDTRISYVTTGVLLQKLIAAKSLNEYTHVILDEVHERDQDMDFALLVVRKLLRTNSKHVKVVLMSATLDSDIFSRYFSLPINGKLHGAPVVSVEGKSFPIHEYYLEEISNIVRKDGMPILDIGEPTIEESQYHTASCLVYLLDAWEINEQGVSNDGFAAERGSVLVFLPGVEYIKNMQRILSDICHGRYLWILPLHSQITNEEQKRIFRDPLMPKNGDPKARKVILSTNIAESSITVPDIKYVIDFCLVKCLVCDAATNYQSLRMQWASKASATQRKGRAGRVSSGKCFRMVTKEFYERCMEPYSVPEFKRAPLEQVVLRVKLLDLGSPKSILSLALQPPDVRDIEKTILILKELGALTIKMRSGVINKYDGELTFMGWVLGKMPCDVRVGKLLVLGHVFGVLEEAIVIGACLSQKTFFVQKINQEFHSYRKKMFWSNRTKSDCLAALNAYKTWKRHKQTGAFGRTGERKWCKENLIEHKKILEVEKVVNELTERLAKVNIETSRDVHHRRQDSTSHDELILKVVICGSFYPNYFLSGEIDERDARKTMSGHDPFTTIMLRSLPIHGHYYSSAIAKLLEKCGRAKNVHTESRRAYVEFERQDVQDTVLPAVYLALKMRHLQMHLNLWVAKEDQKRIVAKSAAKMEIHNSRALRTDRIMASVKDSSGKTTKEKNELQKLELPEVGFMDIYISEVIDAGHFWAQPGDGGYAAKLSQLMEDINNYTGTQHEFLSLPCPMGTLCLALYDEDERYYRAKVVSFNGSIAKVFYVDYGNTANVSTQHLRKIREEHTRLPFLAFECRLICVRPSFGAWDEEAKQRFIELTWDKNLVAKVFSRLHGVFRVDLIDTVSSEDDVHIHQVLIGEGFANFTEESYDSVRTHEDAVARLELVNNVGTGENEGYDPTGWVESDTSSTEAHLTGNYKPDDGKITKVNLSGPFSPYEMSFYSMTCIGRLRAAKIERDSVNSIVLNEEPQDKHERFLVAANIGVNTSGTVMLGRDTTLMPNIHGLSALISLVFTPCAEFRTNEKKDRYTGAIVGLGFDPSTGEALLPDHDIELQFNFAFKQDDVVKINACRSAINLAVASKEKISQWGKDAIQKIQRKTRATLLELLLTPRDDRQISPYIKMYQWNRVDPQDLLSPYNPGELDDDATLLYPFHYPLDITESFDEEIPDYILQRRQSVENLRPLAGGSTQPFAEPVVCDLCNVHCRHPRGLRMHLETRSHRMEENYLFDDRYVYNH